MLTGESERKEWKKLSFDLLPSFFFSGKCLLPLSSLCFFPLTFSASFFLSSPHTFQSPFRFACSLLHR